MENPAQSPKFVYVTIIQTTPEKLWAALTAPEFTSQYFLGATIESDWRVGSPVAYRQAGGEVSDEGTVLKCEPPRLLSYTFNHVKYEELRGEPASQVTFQIEPLDNATGGLKGKVVRLTVTHENFQPGSKLFNAISNGWPVILSALKTVLETGTPLDLTKMPS